MVFTTTFPTVRALPALFVLDLCDCLWAGLGEGDRLLIDDSVAALWGAESGGSTALRVDEVAVVEDNLEPADPPLPVNK